MNTPEFRILKDGTQEWRLNGKRHRVEGPSVIFPDGSRWWCLDGLTHRVGGPAVESAYGTREWWLHGVLQWSQGRIVRTNH
jgi:hypothetical protein